MLVTNRDLVGSCVDYFPITSIWDLSNFKNDLTSCCRLFYNDKTLTFFGYPFSLCQFALDLLEAHKDMTCLDILDELDCHQEDRDKTCLHVLHSLRFPPDLELQRFPPDLEIAARFPPDLEWRGFLRIWSCRGFLSDSGAAEVSSESRFSGPV